jgi:endo-1,4-beta-xylanase
VKRLSMVSLLPLLLACSGSSTSAPMLTGTRAASLAYCTPNRTVAPLPNTQSGSFNSTGQVCFVVQNTGPLGFNCSNMQGRTVTVNGTPFPASACAAGAKVPYANGGQYYFDVSAGGLAYASIAFWAESGPGGSPPPAPPSELDGACKATLSAGQTWADRYNLNVTVSDSSNWVVTMTYPNQEKMIATWNIDAEWPQSNVLVARPNGNGNTFGVTIKPNGNWTWPTVTCDVDLIPLAKEFTTGTLAEAAAQHARYFGGVSDNPDDTLAKHFSAVTPENCGKWDKIHPSENTYDFSKFESVVSWAKKQDPPLLVRGHTLVWSKQLPSWVQSFGTNGQMKTMLQKHVHTILDRAIGKYWQPGPGESGSAPYTTDPWNLYAYDVVNEAILQDGSRRPAGWPTSFNDDHSPFEQALPGPNYVPGGTTNHTRNDWIYIAFRAARDHVRTHWATDNRPLLCYNDFEIENVNTKSDAVYELIYWLNHVDMDPWYPDQYEKLVDCVGMQSHFREDEVSHRPNAIPDELTPGKTVLDNMKRFAAMGVEIQVTELDTRKSMGTTYTFPDGHKVTQDDAFRIITEACLQVPECRGITQWGVRDSSSWIGSAEAPLLLDDNGNAKAVYNTVLGVLRKDEVSVIPSTWAPADGVFKHGIVTQGGRTCDSATDLECTWLYDHDTTVTFTGSCPDGGTGQWDRCEGTVSGNTCTTSTAFLGVMYVSDAWYSCR